MGDGKELTAIGLVFGGGERYGQLRGVPQTVRGPPNGPSLGLETGAEDVGSIPTSVRMPITNVERSCAGREI